MKKGMLVLIVGILMIGVVSASVNMVQQSGTTETCTYTTASGGTASVLGNCAKTSDGNFGTYYGVEHEYINHDGTGACSLTGEYLWGSVEKINNIEFKVYSRALPDGNYAWSKITLVVYVKQGGSWNQVYTDTINGGNWEDGSWLDRTIQQSLTSGWEGVSGVKIDCSAGAYSYEGNGYQGTKCYIYELQAWTPPCECSLGTCCSDGCNYDAAGTVCDDTDHCSGETWYTGYGCDGAGSCTTDYGSQDKDNDESYCISIASGCTPRGWALGGEVAQTTCCGDDAGEFQDGAGSCDGTHACCDSVSDVVKGGDCVSECINLQWENLDGEGITSANLGDTIRLVLNGEESVDFSIYEEDELLNPDDYIRTMNSTEEDGEVVAYWTITEEDLELTEDYDDFYFEVDSGKKSGSLSISKSYSNTPMAVQISSPICGEYFNAGSGEVNIVVSATDADDFIEGYLSVNGLQITTFGNQGVTAGYVFSEGGNYKIVAEGINSRGQKKRVISNVMVIDTTVDGEYVAACILKPKDYSDIPTSYVEFDASNSRGIRYSTATGISEIDPSDLSFDWFFSDGRTNPYPSGNELSYRFFKNFYSVGNNWATLQVSMI